MYLEVLLLVHAESAERQRRVRFRVHEQDFAVEDGLLCVRRLRKVRLHLLNLNRARENPEYCQWLDTDGANNSKKREREK